METIEQKAIQATKSERQKIANYLGVLRGSIGENMSNPECKLLKGK